MFRYLLSCLRLLGMYAEQGGSSAYIVVILLIIAFLYALCISFFTGFLILLILTIGIPWEAERRTREATSPLPPVTLPRNQAVTTLYFPGLMQDDQQMKRYMDKSGFPGALGLLVNPICIEPYDATNFLRFNVAQDGDFLHALEQVLRIMKERPHDRFIFFGTSRGAAVALRVAADLYADQISRVAFTVCEGIFDTAPAIFEARFSPWLARWLQRLLPVYTLYRNEYKHTPLWVAEHFAHHNHPVLCVTSLNDTVVPHENTVRVFHALVKQAGKSELLVLKESPHSSYATWKDMDRIEYVKKMQEWINTFV